MRPRPSVPIVTELYWPTLPARSTVVRVAEVQATLEQWATLRSPLVSSKELMRPRPSAPMVTELNRPTLPEPSRVVSAYPERSRAVSSAPTLRVSPKPKRSPTPKAKKVFLDILIVQG